MLVGDAIPCGMEFPGNPVVIRFDQKVEDINEWIMKNGIGHHWMVGYGDWSDILEKYCKMRNILYYSM